MVLGAGSAGLMAALTLKRKLPHLTLRVVRSPDIGVIGVGEGTTAVFPRHFFEYSDALFCDRAVIGGWPRAGEPIHPYTTVETMDAGWCWQIVHSSNSFRMDGFLAMLVGQNVPHQKAYIPPPIEQNFWKQHRARLKQEADKAMDVKEALGAIRSPGLKWA